MGTDKRERQKTGRLARAEAELVAARRARRRRTVVRTVIGVAVVVALLFAWSAIQGDDGGDDEDGDEATSDTAETTTTTAPDYANPELAQEVLDRDPPDPAPPPEDTPADALEVSTVIEGEGEGAAAGDQVTVHYVGKLADGSVFDESWGRGQPLPLPLGQGQVIPGWDEGMVGAKIGERRRLVIGSDNAYGEQGSGDDGVIPPNSPLAFEVDVIDIQPDAAASPSMPAPGGG